MSRRIRIKRGQKVVIVHNPFHERAKDIVATVKKWMPGEGHMGCDLAELEYRHPGTGEKHVLPFRACNFQAVDPGVLRKMADKYEAEAADFRKMADEIESEAGR
ncbi:MAG: hypothetical protein HQL31_14040 [Planctomycetes bacterium]|nr:hypothetical protein [Planctomycetota bacterium]